MELSRLGTEQLNDLTAHLDQMTSYEVVSVMNAEDVRVPMAVQRELNNVADAVDLIVQALAHGGRLIYLGAGTSGRLGLLDAAECPPTFGTPADLVFGLLAGGETAFFRAVEGAEDDESGGVVDLEKIRLDETDVVVGISASGRTPYVVGGLGYARRVKAKVIALSCNRNAEVSPLADVAIEVDTGPEVVGGSTRLKAGTAQKMVLNMLSTAAMVRLGKVHGNLLVDMNPSNAKLIDRACRIIMRVTEYDYDDALKVLKAAKYEMKPAIVMAIRGSSLDEAKKALDATNGFVRPLLEYEKEYNNR